MKLALRPYGRVGLAACAALLPIALTGCGGGSNSNAGQSTPQVTGIAPGTGIVGSTVTITGDNFASGSVVKFGTVPATSETVTSSTSISAVAPAGSGTVAVTVTDANGTSQTSNSDLFSYGSAPAITSLTPTQGTTGTSVTIAGTNLDTSAPTVNFSGTPVTPTSATQTSVVFTVPTGFTGTVASVSVTTGFGTSNSSSFTDDAAPTVSNLSPNTGSNGTSIAVTGTGFTSGSTVTIGGPAATSVTYNSATSLTVVAPSGVNGPQNLVVTNPDGLSATATFTYAAPTITSVTPSSGISGQALTIQGTNFTPNSTSHFILTSGGGVGQNIPLTFTFVNSTTLTANAPTETTGTTANLYVQDGNGASAAYPVTF